MSSVAPRHKGSFWSRDGICVPFIFRQIPIHCTTREVPQCILLSYSACFSLVQLSLVNPWIEVSAKLETWAILSLQESLGITGTWATSGIFLSCLRSSVASHRLQNIAEAPTLVYKVPWDLASECLSAQIYYSIFW